MIYYAVAYMNNGEIHLKPHTTKEHAEHTLELLKNSEKGSEVKLTKIVKKDPNSPWFRSVNGYWI